MGWDAGEKDWCERNEAYHREMEREQARERQEKEARKAQQRRDRLVADRIHPEEGVIYLLLTYLRGAYREVPRGFALTESEAILWTEEYDRDHTRSYQRLLKRER